MSRAARSAAGEWGDPAREAAREVGCQRETHVSPCAGGEGVAAAYGERAKRRADKLRDRTVRAEHLGDFIGAGFHLGVACKRILVRERTLERLIHLRIPHLVHFDASRLDHHRERLHQRTHQQRTQRPALRIGQARQHLLVDILQRVSQLRAVAVERLLHQLTRAGSRIALVLDHVKACADLGQRVHIALQHRAVVLLDHDPAECRELLANRAHRQFDRVTVDVDVRVDLTHRRRRPAVKQLLEPARDASLRAFHAGAKERRVVPRSLVVSGFEHLADRRVLRVAQSVHRIHGLVEGAEVLHRDALHELLPVHCVLGLVHRHQRFLDLLRAAFECQVVMRRRVEHPVLRLQFLGRGIADRRLHVLEPCITRERAGDCIAAGNQAGVVVADNAGDRHRREAG